MARPVLLAGNRVLTTRSEPFPPGSFLALGFSETAPRKIGERSKGQRYWWLSFDQSFGRSSRYSVAVNVGKHIVPVSVTRNISGFLS